MFIKKRKIVIASITIKIVFIVLLFYASSCNCLKTNLSDAITRKDSISFINNAIDIGVLDSLREVHKIDFWYLTNYPLIYNFFYNEYDSLFLEKKIAVVTIGPKYFQEWKNNLLIPSITIKRNGNETKGIFSLWIIDRYSILIFLSKKDGVWKKMHYDYEDVVLKIRKYHVYEYYE